MIESAALLEEAESATAVRMGSATAECAQAATAVGGGLATANRDEKKQQQLF